MPRTRSIVALRSDSGRSTPWTDQRVINMYAQQGTPDTKSKAVLYGTPGIKEFATPASTKKLRGGCVQDDLIYILAGDTLYSVNSAGTSTAISGTVPLTTPAKLVPGRTNIAILLSDGRLYAYDGSSVSEVTDPDLPSVQDATYQDGYLIVAEKGSDRFYISNLFDFGTFDALDFATAESLGDDIVATISDRAELWHFGRRTIEFWYNSGATFPFERRDVIQRGCLARDSVTSLDNTLIWLGDDGVVYQAAGYQPQRVSTHAVEYAIGQDPQPQSASATTYTQEGHKFYVLQLSDETWVYDVTTGLWHERQSYQDNPWRIDGTLGAFGKVLGWDYDSAKLFELDLDTYTEDGGVIRRIVQTPVIHNDGRRTFMDRFQIDMETGIGLTTGQGSDPQVLLSYSDDGGRTWSSQKFLSVGKRGTYYTRVYRHRLGSFYDRIMQIVMSDPVKPAIYAMNIDLTSEGE